MDVNNFLEGYWAWMHTTVIRSTPTLPFLFMIFLSCVLFFERRLETSPTEKDAPLTKKKDLQHTNYSDVAIMAGFGGTLLSIYIAASNEQFEILDALSGALLSSIFGIVIALIITIAQLKVWK